MDKLTFHKGMDYAVVMRPNQTTDDALAHLYGRDKDVTKFGTLFAVAPRLLDEVKEFRRTVAYYIEREKNGNDPEGVRLKRIKLTLLDDLIASASGVGQ